MARKKNPQTPDASAVPSTTAAAPAQTTPPGAFVPPPPGVWTQPKLRVVESPGQPSTPAAEATKPAEPPAITVEQVLDAERPTARIHGYDAAVAVYIDRDMAHKSEEIALEEGKSWFREMARKFKRSHGLLTLFFASAKGSVEVTFSSTRSALKDPMIAKVRQSTALQNLLYTEEVLDPKEASTWLLDNARILTPATPAAPQGVWLTMRQAIEQGLAVEAKKVTKLRPDYEKVYATLKGTLTPAEQELYEQLEAAGTNAPAVKTPR